MDFGHRKPAARSSRCFDEGDAPLIQRPIERVHARRIRQVARSANSLTGKQRLTPEASVALQDLSAIRQALAGGREALAQVRFYVVVYGEPAHTRSELAASLKAKPFSSRLEAFCREIDSLCEAFEKFPAAVRDAVRAG